MTLTDTTPAIVPNFDEESDTGRKLAIICSKGNLDMAYPGLVLANAALGEGVETHLFFTFWGFDMITKSRMNGLQFSRRATQLCTCRSGTPTCRSRWLRCRA
jgi:peroxiredoxin family protein